MVKHIVLYTFRENVDKEASVRLIASLLEPLVGKIPGLTHLEIRRAYNGADYALYSEFTSREALSDYASNPLHLAAKEQFFHLLDKRFAADYEVSGGSATKAIVSVVGKDRVGIIAGVCTALAKYNVNVLDISQTVMQGYFTMVMAAEISRCTVPMGELISAMDAVGREMGLSIQVQREEIFEAMHRL